MTGLSVVIPTYQQSQFLNQALDSIAATTDESIEVIVVDDGSDPELSHHVATHAKLDVRLVRQEHAGAGAARNRGILEARFDVIMFLDADDLWDPRKLDIQLERYWEYPKALHFGWVREFLDESLKQQGAGRPQTRTLTGPSAITLCCSRAQFDEHGGFNQDLRTGEFIEWLLRLQREGVESQTFPEILAWRRVHAGNRGRRVRSENSDYAKILREHLSKNATSVD